jgi:hypothetical protein
MRLVKRLFAGDLELPMTQEHVELGLNQVGAGWFDVQDDGSWTIPATQNVFLRYWVGVAGNAPVQTLLGFGVGLFRQDRSTFRLTVRELSAALEAPCPIALRHAVPEDVLAGITAACGLPFAITPGADYLSVLLPSFAAHGTCRQALEAMGPSWEIADAVWFQQPDGSVYWGSYADLGFDATNALVLDPGIVLERQPDARAVIIPLFPGVRPGMVVQADDNQPFTIQRLAIHGHRMRLEWDAIAPAPVDSGVAP